jgi:ribosomal protein S27E
MEFKTLNRYTRAGREGKEIKCPNCGVYSWIYHFSWSSLTCQGCDKSIEKNEWLLKVK